MKKLKKWWNKGRNERVPNEDKASWKELMDDDRKQLTRTDKSFKSGEKGIKGWRPHKAFSPKMVKTGPTPAVRQAFERPVRAVKNLLKKEEVKGMKTFSQFLEEAYLILEKKRQYDDGHGFDRSKHPDLEIDYDRPRGKNQDQSIRGYTSIRHKPSGITYEINHDKKHGNYNMPSDLKGKARKAHGHKPEHNVRWSHDRELRMFRGDEMSRGDRIKTARNAKRVWDKHIQHRIPSGHLVSNEPDDNPDDNRRNPEKNTRASIYQRSGFGKTNRMGKQYATKIGKKLHPVNDDED